MKNTHNKKRNVGVIYELLLRHVSANLIEGKSKDAQKSLNILEKYFNEDTELYREFRLFNALVRSTVSDTPVAAAILTEAKNACRRCDQRSLDREKSLLIKEINYTLNDDNFYHRRVPNYKVYATIQSLLNDWKLGDKSDLSRMVMYESKIVEWLLQEKSEEDIDKEVYPDVDSLVVKILTEKFNKKYSDKLNIEQKNIIKSYVFSMMSDGGTSIRRDLEKIRQKTLSEIAVLERSTDNTVILEKINEVKSGILHVKTEEMNDDVISRFLLMSKLKSELLEDT